jgi:hypothetical protein
MSADDLAALLEVTPRTLRNWAEEGTGPPRAIENLQPIYFLESLVPWLRANRPEIKLGTAARESDEAGRLALLVAWESALCAKYGLDDTPMLYSALRHGHFHKGAGANPTPDPPKYWNSGAYAAISGEIAEHGLSPKELCELLADFDERRDLGLAKEKDMTAAEFSEQISDAFAEQVFAELATDGPILRHEQNHCASAFRYMVCVADDYLFPVPNLPGFLTATQRVQMNDFLEYLEKNCLIPSCKQVKLAAQRQIDDLQRSRAGEKRAG